MKLNWLPVALAAFGCFLFTATAHANEKKDIETIAKSIGFINGGPSGSITMDIVFDPGNPESVAHADEVAAITSGGVGSKVKLTGNKVASPGEATSAVIFVTRGAGGVYAAALDQAVANGGLTVSNDVNCLGGGCVLVVQTQPSVDIFISTAAASKAGVEFASAFSMMITKK